MFALSIAPWSGLVHGQLTPIILFRRTQFRGKYVHLWCKESVLSVRLPLSVCVGSLWAPASAGCVWKLLVLWDHPAVWEWGAGVVRTPRCSSNICSPAITNHREELGAVSNRPARWSFQGILVEGSEQKPTPTTTKPSRCIHPLHPPHGLLALIS